VAQVAPELASVASDEGVETAVEGCEIEVAVSYRRRELEQRPSVPGPEAPVGGPERDTRDSPETRRVEPVRRPGDPGLGRDRSARTDPGCVSGRPQACLNRVGFELHGGRAANVAALVLDVDDVADSGPTKGKQRERAEHEQTPQA